MWNDRQSPQTYKIWRIISTFDRKHDKINVESCLKMLANNCNVIS